MKITLIAVFLVCLVANLNTNHVIIETYDNDNYNYDDDANISEGGDEIGNILASLASRSILIQFTCFMNYEL